jgi:hypothetical protein
MCVMMAMMMKEHGRTRTFTERALPTDTKHKNKELILIIDQSMRQVLLEHSSTMDVAEAAQANRQ